MSKISDEDYLHSILFSGFLTCSGYLSLIYRQNQKGAPLTPEEQKIAWDNGENEFRETFSAFIEVARERKQ